MPDLQEFLDVLPLLLPILLIDWGFKVYAIVDIFKPDRVVRINNNKVVWVLISVLVNFGWIFYFLFGREE